MTNKIAINGLGRIGTMVSTALSARYLEINGSIPLPGSPPLPVFA